MSKMFVFDMDGTLLTSNLNIHPATIQILNETKKAGHLNVIATGRSFQEIHKFVKDYNLFSYYICNNGTYIYDVKNKKKFFDSILPIEMAHVFLKKVSKYNIIFIAHTENGTYRAVVANEQINFNHSEWKEAQKFDFMPLDKIIAKFQYEKITQLSLRSTQENIQKIANSFKQYKNIVNCCISSKTYLDINSKNTSKFSGIEKLMKITGHKIKDIIAFGDTGNDIEMLKMSGYGFCMSNGTNDAKQIANEVIGNHDTNAIAIKVAEFLL